MDADGDHDVIDLRQWWHATVKWKIVACVTGKEDAGRVAKYVQAVLAKGRISREDLGRMLWEVEQESVEPFVRSTWNQPERRLTFRP